MICQGIATQIPEAPRVDPLLPFHANDDVNFTGIQITEYLYT